jgi:uncharacterized protein (UPF0333 family)
MKAQVAVEYLIIVSFALMILIPYVLYLNDLSQSYSETNKLTIAKNSVEKLGRSINWVYSQGEGAKMEIEILVPDGVESIQFLNNTVIWKVRTSAGISDIHYTTVTNVTGNIPQTPGYKVVLIQAFRGYVNVSTG